MKQVIEQFVCDGCKKPFLKGIEVVGNICHIAGGKNEGGVIGSGVLAQAVDQHRTDLLPKDVADITTHWCLACLMEVLGFKNHVVMEKTDLPIKTGSNW
jgi:hypothetical protein